MIIWAKQRGDQVSYQVFLYGYIAIQKDSILEAKAALEKFPFDPKYPFANVFECPRAGYLCSTISFAQGIRLHVGQEVAVWDEWICRFEQLLPVVFSTEACVHLNHEIGEINTNKYLFMAIKDRAKPTYGQWDRGVWAEDLNTRIMNHESQTGMLTESTDTSRANMIEYRSRWKKRSAPQD